MGTTTIDLEEAVHKLILRHHMPVTFYGAFPANKLPTILLNDSSIPPPSLSSLNESKAACCILNTDPSFRNGLHWVAVYQEPHCPLELFDSFALPPATYGFHFPSSSVSNQFPLQASKSAYCGEYCIFFIYLRSLYSSAPSFNSHTLSLSERFNQTCLKIFHLASLAQKRDRIVRDFYCSLSKRQLPDTLSTRALLHYSLSLHPSCSTFSYF